MDVKAAVIAELEKCRLAGSRQPTLRTLRARVGRGSLTTISQAVKEWEASQVEHRGTLAATAPEELLHPLADAVWTVVLPLLRREVDAARAAESADSRAEMSAALQLKSEAEGMLAEAENQKASLERLASRVQEQETRILKLTAALDTAHQEAKELATHLREARRERDAAREEVQELRRAHDALARLVPLLEKKYGAPPPDAPPSA